MTKHYDDGSTLSDKILKGINTLADNVGSTLGPKGRNVILYDKKQNVPVVTKDGVTVAKFISLEDPFEPPVRFKNATNMYGYHKDDAIIFKIGEVQKLEDLL